MSKSGDQQVRAGGAANKTDVDVELQRKEASSDNTMLLPRYSDDGQGVPEPPSIACPPQAPRSIAEHVPPAPSTEEEKGRKSTNTLTERLRFPSKILNF